VRAELADGSLPGEHLPLSELDGLNLLNARAPQAEYAHGSLIKTDSLFAMCNSAAPPPNAVGQNGVMDYALHPIEPLAIRLTVAATF